MSQYRKIYEQYYGVNIPRGHHIHHKDMNHENNDPLNLEALTPDEHAQKHGFISNFIMAQATASQLAAIANKGRKHTLEQRQARSLWMKKKNNLGFRMKPGYKQDEEWKQKRSASMMGVLKGRKRKRG